MPELSKQELDKLFQQVSEHQEYPYDPEAWAAMEKMLDREQRRLLWWRWLLGLLLFFMLTGSLYFWSTKHPSQPNTQQKSTPNINHEQPVDPAENTSEFSSLKKRESAANDSTNNQAGKPSYKTKKERTRAQENNKTKIIPTSSTHARRQISMDETATKTVNENSTRKKPSNSPPEEGGLDSSTTGETENHIPPTEVRTDKQAALAWLPPLTMDLQPTVHRAWEASSTPLSPLITKQSRLFKPTFVIAAGMLWTTTRPAQFDAPGGKAGIQIEVPWRQQTAFAIGAYFSHIDYSARGEDYHPPKGFWTNGIVPEQVKGECNILEIPVLVNWSPKSYFSNGLFIEGGLVSYLMLNENYQYSYKEQLPGLVKNWHGQNENRHWFGIAQFSLGYRKVFGRHGSSIEWTPFVQFPLNGIGHGRVKLSNIGLSMKYRIAPFQ